MIGTTATSSLSEMFSAALPTESIVTDARVIGRLYRRNATAFDRDVPLVLRPACEQEVGDVVMVANEYRIPLYPLSTGKNWGVGSKLPVVDDCVLVDLSGMNRIVEVNEEFCYSIIEPGVTQAQLAAYLRQHHPGVTVNFTEAHAHTGILGNVLERGNGGWGCRVDDLLGVEGILGSGKPFYAGGIWRHVNTGRPSHHYRFPAGPDLAGVFCQSSFGVVTKMAFRLLPWPDAREMFWGTVADAELERLVNFLDDLSKQRVIQRGCVNIGYANRFVEGKRSLTQDAVKADVDDQVWNFYVLVEGSPRMTGPVVQILRDVFADVCLRTDSFDIRSEADPYQRLPDFLHPTINPLMGLPDDDSLKMIYNLTKTPLPADASAMDADHTPFGFKTYEPVVPLRGPYVRRAADIIGGVRQRFGLNIPISFFGDGRSLVTIQFRSDDPRQVALAEVSEAVIWDQMVDAGYPPYQVGIDQMERLMELDPEYFQWIFELKSLFDPNHIISPGRYCPLDSGP